MVLFWHSDSTAAGLSDPGAARHLWHEGELAAGQAVLEYHGRQDGPCVSRNTDHCDDRMLCYLLRTSSPGLWVWDGILAWFMVLVFMQSY